MEDTIKTVLYQGYLALENGDEAPPILVTSYFYTGDTQYRLQNKFNMNPRSINLEQGTLLYVATEQRESDNPEQHQKLLLNFQNYNNDPDPGDWTFSQPIDLQDREQLALLKTFAENRVHAFLLYPDKAPNHFQPTDLIPEI